MLRLKQLSPIVLVMAASIGCATMMAREDRMENKTHSKSQKGSILLIHGSAPFNQEGRVPDSRAGLYSKTEFYKNLAQELEKSGWFVLRYNKPGVYQDRIDFEIYKTTDLVTLSKQLNELWVTLPTDRPRLIFAWSEGSLHAALLPLNEADGVILLGAISSNIRDVILWQSRGEELSIEKQLKDLEGLPRTEMLGLDRPAGRLIDELRLPNNWTGFRQSPSVPILILHGDSDSEVPVSQAIAWEKELGHKQVTTAIRKNANHIFGFGEADGAEAVAVEIQRWWETLPNKEAPRRKVFE